MTVIGALSAFREPGDGSSQTLVGSYGRVVGNPEVSSKNDCGRCALLGAGILATCAKGWATRSYLKYLKARPKAEFWARTFVISSSVDLL
jgi:hypothetical protein